MDLISLEELKALSERRDGPSVSLFMPTHRLGMDAAQDPIRLKNLLRQAEQDLIVLGLRSPDARRLLKPASRLVGDSAFWRHQSDGLALFAARGAFFHYRLPIRFSEFVAVGERWHVKPLLPLFTGDGHFFILALSQNQVRLLEGTRYSVDEIALEGVPTSMVEALGSIDVEKHLQFHTRTQAPGTGERMVGFHGHDPADEAKTRILQYFRRVSEALSQMLRGERAPLVLAGVEYLLPLYRQASSYPSLLDQTIGGNPESLTPAELHRRSWEIVQPLLLRARETAKARYREMIGTGRTSASVEETVVAAHHGRVDVLFVPVGVQRWGFFDAGTERAHLSAEPQPGYEDLLDLAAVQTLSNGGTVYAVEPQDMPEDRPVAAILRF